MSQKEHLSERTDFPRPPARKPTWKVQLRHVCTVFLCRLIENDKLCTNKTSHIFSGFRAFVAIVVIVCYCLIFLGGGTTEVILYYVLESGALLYGHKSLELFIHSVVLVEQAKLCMLPK